MTTSADIFTGSSKTPEETNTVRAQRAVKNFRDMLPMLNSYARVMTGKRNIEVVLHKTSNGMTDGKKIYFRPPVELGDNTPHNRHLCDHRGDNLQQLCKACRIREDILTVIFHEIAHISFDSFKKTSDADIQRSILAAIEDIGQPEYADAIRKRIEDLPKFMREQYFSLAKMVNEYLPMILNCLEDARVNTELFDARAGCRTMFEAMTSRIFNEGYEGYNAEGQLATLHWRDAPINLQAMVACFCEASGYDYSDFFIPEVIDTLKDPELKEILGEVTSMPSVDRVYDLAFKVLLKLREYGYCQDRYDPPKPTEKSEADSEEEMSSDGSDGSTGSDGSPGTSGVGEVPGGETSKNEDDTADSGSGSSPYKEESTSESSSESGSDPESSSALAGDSVRGDDPDSGEDRETLDNSDDPSETDELHDEEYGGLEADDPGAAEEHGSASDDGSEPVDLESLKRRILLLVLPEGTPEDVEKGLKIFGDHAPEKKPTKAEQALIDEIIIAITQQTFFDTSSVKVWGVREIQYDTAIREREYTGWHTGGEVFDDSDYKPSESILGSALLRMRVAFAENQRSRNLHHLKSGKVNARALGKRAPLNDDRLFKKRIIPGKRNYFVCICLDISGSTYGKNLQLLKASAYAQAELCHRTGVDFAIYAHTGDTLYADDSRLGYQRTLDIYQVKTDNQPWDSAAKNRLVQLHASSANLDGHALEYFRKACDRSMASNKIILYYSDGEMPAENRIEELEILKREILNCRRKGYTLLGVGVNTDSPAHHGLETVEVNTQADVIKVIKQLEKKLVLA